MKLFGSIRELVSAVFRKDGRQISLKPSTSVTYTADRDVELPPRDGADVLVGTQASQTLLNKNLEDSSNFVVDSVDATKRVRIDAGGTTNTTTVISASQTANRTLSLPDATDTLVARNTTETLQNKTLGSTNNISGATASTLTNGGTVTLPSSGTLATLSGSETLTNKNLASSTNSLTGAVAASFTNSGATITLPTTTSTLSTLALSETLTNKNLANSNNTLSGATATGFTNGGTVSLPSGTTTLLGNNTSQVVTNKDIDGGTASNTSRITLPSANTATLSGLTRKAGTLVYDSQTGLVNYDNGSTLSALASAGLATPNAAGLVTSFTPTIKNAYFSTSANYTVTDTDGYEWIVVNTSGGVRTITLPTSANNKGRRLAIIKSTSDTNHIIVTKSVGSSDTIGGLTTGVDQVIGYNNSAQSIVLNTSSAGSKLILVSDGAGDWRIEDATGGFGQVTNFSGRKAAYKRDGTGANATGDGVTVAINSATEFIAVNKPIPPGTYLVNATAIVDITFTTGGYVNIACQLEHSAAGTPGDITDIQNAMGMLYYPNAAGVAPRVQISAIITSTTNSFLYIKAFVVPYISGAAGSFSLRIGAGATNMTLTRIG